jgi:predicted TIM-barrel fold metal-dependent hydrolase
MWLIGGIPVPEWTPELALEFMDAHGIAVQMLSVSDPGVEFVDGERAPALTRECNDYVAGVIGDHPGRFGAFAVLAMSDVQGARVEALRCLDELSLDGVALLSSYDGLYLGDPHFEPLLSGGTLPMLRARLAAASAGAKDFGALIGMPAGCALLTADSAHTSLAGSLYDTALIADPPALRAVAGVADPGHLLFGSDWPFAARMYASEGDPQPALGEVFSGDQLRAVERAGALAQFGHLANHSGLQR